MPAARGVDDMEPGARWLRCDLHVHTPFDGEKKFGEDVRAAVEALRKSDTTRLAEMAERFVEACRAAAGGEGVDLVALTDHNSIEGYKQLRPFFDSIAQRADPSLRMPAILPGVELSVGGERPLHFLVIFASDTDPQQIERLIAHVFGARDPFDAKRGTPRATGESVSEFLAKLYAFCRPPSGDRSLEFVVIPAHADGSSGVAKETGGPVGGVANNVWDDMRGHLRELTVSRRDWNGFQTRRPFQELPSALKDLLLRWAAARRGEEWDQLTQSQKEAYRQQRHWALLECSDPHRYEAIGGRFSWLKMEMPDVEGIRLALLDPESRLRRMADGPPRRDYPRIEGIVVEETDFFEKIEVPFNSCLTAMIGGRGSGKSTLVEYLRLALDRGRPRDFPGDGSSELRERFEKLVREKPTRDHGRSEGTLLPDHRISVDVVVSGRRYRIVREAGGTSVIRDPDTDTAEPMPLDVRSLIAPRILSQRQISRIARDPAAQRSELDALLDGDDIRRFESERAGLLERLQSLQATRRRLRERELTLPARRTDLQRVRDQIDFLEGSGGRQILSRFDAYEREKRWLGEASRTVEEAAIDLDDAAGRVEALPARLGPPPQGGPNEAWLRELSERASHTATETGRSVRERAATLREEGTRIGEERTAHWQPGYDTIREHYEQLREELATRGVDFAQHEKLLQQRAGLEREVAELERIDSELERTERDITEARLDLVRLHEWRAELRGKQAGTLEEADADVRMTVLGFRDRQDFESRREDWFSGAGLQERDWSTLVDHVFEPSGSVPDRIARLVDALRSDLAAVATDGGRVRASNATAELVASRGGQLTGHFQRVLERGDRVRLDDIERFLPDDEVETTVRGADGSFKPITTGSVGEKSTAILSLLLSAGNQPLVVDQPEDDLDNRYVYEVVVKLLRRRKFSRQIVIATHNANIPVNGDAELIVALGAQKQLGRVQALGSIDRPEVKEDVSVIMEGSAEAFRLRQERYGY